MVPARFVSLVVVCALVSQVRADDPPATPTAPAPKLSINPLDFPPPSHGPDFVAMSIEDLMKIEITTASRKGQPAEDAAAAVFVITHDAIRRSGRFAIDRLDFRMCMRRAQNRCLEGAGPRAEIVEIAPAPGEKRRIFESRYGAADPACYAVCDGGVLSVRGHWL